jgi:hypothetical protein
MGPSPGHSRARRSPSCPTRQQGGNS